MNAKDTSTPAETDDPDGLCIKGDDRCTCRPKQRTACEHWTNSTPAAAETAQPAAHEPAGTEDQLAAAEFFHLNPSAALLAWDWWHGHCQRAKASATQAQPATHAEVLKCEGERTECRKCGNDITKCAALATQAAELPPKPRLTKWTPTTDLMTLRRTGKSLEELGELVAVVARCIIQGIDEIDPGSGKVNRVRLEDEIADVLAQCLTTIKSFDLDEARINARVLEKSRQMAEWEAMFKDDRCSRCGRYENGSRPCPNGNAACPVKSSNLHPCFTEEG